MSAGVGAETFAFIALGSNLGDSRQLLLRAFQGLQTFSDRPLRRSSLWRSSPVDCPPGSAPFLNAVALISVRTAETPERLLEGLQGIEERFGRRPKMVINEPRPLDLDLIAFGSELRTTAPLVLPHPRAHLRRFVLQPLAEIAPEYVLPLQTKTVGQLLEELRTDEVVILMIDAA